jgi:hypothetical protein
MEVLLAAAQREVIDLHVKVVQSAKLEPRAIDVEPIAVARAATQDKRAGGLFVDYDDVSALLKRGRNGHRNFGFARRCSGVHALGSQRRHNLTTAISEGLVWRCTTPSA